MTLGPIPIISAALLVGSVLLTILPVNLDASAQNSAGAPPETVVAKPYRAEPLTTFTSISARPLFAKERRRGSAPSTEVVENDEVVAEAEELTAILFGVLEIDDEVRVLAAPRPDSEAHWRRVGDRVQGWELSEIYADRAVFVNGSQSKTLYLYEQDAAAFRPSVAADEKTSENQ